MKKLFVILVHYKNKESTLACLASLTKTKEIADIQSNILVVDNASHDDIEQDIKKEFPDTIVITNKINTGFGGGMNIGIQYGLEKGGDYFLILNNDTLLDKNMIGELLETIEKDKAVGIVVPKIYFASGFEFHKQRYTKQELGHIIWYAGGEIDWKNMVGFHKGVDEVDSGQYDRQEQTTVATGCCMLVKREVFEKVGIFDEKYFLYYEDADLSMRTKQAGYTILYNPKAFLWHKNAASTGGSGSGLQDYYITRGRLLFAFRFAPIRLKLLLVQESIRLLLSGRRWQKKGIIDFFSGRFGKGSYRP